MGCLTWEFITSVGKSPTDPGRTRFDLSFVFFLSLFECYREAEVLLMWSHRVLRSSSSWTHRGSATSLHRWKQRGTFRQETWKGCLRMRRGLWCKRHSLAGWRKLCYWLCTLQLIGISFQWQWLIQGRKPGFAYLKIRASVSALLSGLQRFYFPKFLTLNMSFCCCFLQNDLHLSGANLRSS